MNTTTAWRFMVAACDDPVLASWASVCHEYHLVSATEISPYEAWEAYQDLFNHGIVTPAEYDAADVKKTFFSGHPETADIQDVLERIKFLCPGHEPTNTEISMSSKSSFFQNANSIATRDKAPSRGLPAPQRPEPLGGAFAPKREAFEPKREVMPQPKRDLGGGLEAFARLSESPRSKSGLACQDPTPMGSGVLVGGRSYLPDIRCGRQGCGAQIQMNELGTEILPEDGDPSTASLLVAVFEGKCHSCGIVHHCSVAEDTQPDEHR